jgi:hypothetical protein
MHPSKTIPEPWLSFLQELDSAVHEEVRMDCMGGFVVTIVYSSTSGYSHLIPTILRCQSWNVTSREIETMSSTWRE